ncbi:hypothetical protein IEQ34_007044 [Dendrobium chrysotoxum]|uniref:Uncharacterized protein n=1 Tax=Dendrobium chrysotoxum TaxID=161865 RepID=A0AAV7H9M8_DENCH|nr:hypothetical protein IEQ34_007044 [Dendrobium chrysotoxum]
MELWLAQLLFYFDWELPGGRSPQELDVKEAFGVTLTRIMLIKYRISSIRTPVHLYGPFIDLHTDEPNWQLCFDVAYHQLVRGVVSQARGPGLLRTPIPVVRGVLSGNRIGGFLSQCFKRPFSVDKFMQLEKVRIKAENLTSFFSLLEKAENLENFDLEASLPRELPQDSPRPQEEQVCI